MKKKFFSFKIRRSACAVAGMGILLAAALIISIYVQQLVGLPVGALMDDKFPELYALAQTSGGSEAEPGKVVYLTFDDGPSPITEEILDILGENEIKGTFFVIGPSGEETDARLKRIADEGHAIGVHSYCHKYAKIYSSVENWLTDFETSREWIYSVIGERPDFFRFPGGSNNSTASPGTLSSIRQEMARRGFVWFDWNTKGGDDTSSFTSADTIARRILSNARGKERIIVLCHDSSTRQTTADALQTIIDEYRCQGYEFGKLGDSVKPMQFKFA